MVEAEGGHTQEREGVGDKTGDGFKGLDEGHQDAFADGRLLLHQLVGEDADETEDGKRGPEAAHAAGLVEAVAGAEQSGVEQQGEQAVIREQGAEPVPHGQVVDDVEQGCQGDEADAPKQGHREHVERIGQRCDPESMQNMLVAEDAAVEEAE